MARIAAIFPNEGSHYVGMGKEFYDRSMSTRKFFDDTEKTLSLKIMKLCFMGPIEEQNQIANAHLLMLLTEVAFFDLLIQYKRKPETLTGVGIGEIAALVNAECLPFDNAMQFVLKRAKLLEAFAEKHPGMAISISGLPLEQLQPLLNRTENKVFVTHYLAPDTHILWGPAEMMAGLQTKLQGVKNVKTHTQLPRGPIFTPLASELEGECDKLLTECLGEEKLKNPKIAYHSCADGEYCGTIEQAREVLVKQYSRPVQWVKLVKTLNERGLRTWVEVGPGKVWGNLVRKVDTDNRVSNVEDAKSLSVTVKVTG